MQTKTAKPKASPPPHKAPPQREFTAADRERAKNTQTSDWIKTRNREKRGPA